MPTKPARPCQRNGCPNITNDPSRLCSVHLTEARHLDDARRGSPSERGYDSRWHKARTAYLREHPLCVGCQEEGRIIAATTVDHIRPHRGDYDLMWDESNWQSLCTWHHNVKTASEDGAFGNPEKR